VSEGTGIAPDAILTFWKNKAKKAEAEVTSLNAALEIIAASYDPLDIRGHVTTLQAIARTALLTAWRDECEAEAKDETITAMTERNALQEMRDHDALIIKSLKAENKTLREKWDMAVKLERLGDIDALRMLFRAKGGEP
jgi:hypothetical protein